MPLCLCPSSGSINRSTSPLVIHIGNWAGWGVVGGGGAPPRETRRDAQPGEVGARRRWQPHAAPHTWRSQPKPPAVRCGRAFGVLWGGRCGELRRRGVPTSCRFLRGRTRARHQSGRGNTFRAEASSVISVDTPRVLVCRVAAAPPSAHVGVQTGGAPRPEGCPLSCHGQAPGGWLAGASAAAG